ncbi:MAG: 2-phosphosulfolactate phosphatase [Proteobacteria bacterium]|nr:2-phosphosulfolactate phosphatase [Pseudomonadota bacterium]
MPVAHCEWGPNGVLAFRDRVAALVIVDVLSFSTAVDISTARGAQIVPFPLGDQVSADEAAKAAGAVLASPKRAAGGQYSLSPASLQTIASGTRLMLPSPNGSRLSLMGGSAAVFAGCLRNARAVAQAARALGGDVAVIPAGERWRSDDSLRPAIEDLLGAGAILDALDLPLSPEARVARDVWLGARDDFADVIRASLSGQELIGRDFAQDVELAVASDASHAAPRLRDGAYSA